MPSRSQLAAIRAAGARPVIAGPISLRVLGALNNLTTGTSITPVIPATAQAGDFMLAYVSCRSGTGIISPTFVTAPLGWTHIGSGWSPSSVPANQWRIGFYYRFWQSGDANPQFFTSAANTEQAARISCWSNVNAGTPIDVASASSEFTGSTTVPCDALTSATDGACFVNGIATNAANAAGPSAISNAFTKDWNDAFSNHESAMAHKVLTPAGAMGATNWTVPAAGEVCRLVTICLRPA